MKNVILLLLSLLAYSTSQLTISSAIGEMCDESSGKGMINLTLSGTPDSDLNFTLTLTEKDGTNTITAQCTAEGSSDTDSLISDQATDEEVESSISSSADTRILAESSVAVCLFDAPSADGTYELTKIDVTTLTLSSGLTVTVIACSEEGTTDEVDPGKQEAERLAKLTLTFRQLNGFKYTDSEITFMFYALTTSKLTKGEIIYLIVQLIHQNGDMNEDEISATCTLQSDADPGSKGLAAADFSCSIKGFTGGPYKSFRLLRSDYISDIPTDETLLNPLLTALAIANGLLPDLSKSSAIPAIFTFKSLSQDTCKTDGKFTITGEFSETTTYPTKFEIPLTYPENKTLTCSINGNNLECITDREIEDEIIIQQTIVKQDAKELFILKAITGQELSCGNGLLIQAEAKANVKISFRQVSQLKFDSSSRILSFFLAAFLNSQVSTSDEIILKVLLLISGTQVQRDAKCKLATAVTYSGEPVQGDFNCQVQLESGETVDITDPNAVIISPDNDQVGGCSELTDLEASPKLTDDAIAAGNITDFSKEKTVPPIFTISGFGTDRCEKKGKLKVKGKFTGTFENPITFTLPFTFPSSKIKCTIESKDDTEISCKVLKTFSGVKSLVIEPRTFKKYNREYLFIKSSKIFAASEEFNCGDFNSIKKQNAIKAKKAQFTFLQMGRRSGFLFFLAIIKKMATAFEATMKLKIEYLLTTSRLRFLEEYDEEKEVSCTQGDNTADTSAFSCSDSSISGTPTTAELDPEQVGGASDETKIEENPSPDYSQKANLESIQNAPKVTISSLNGDKCMVTGDYTIEGTIESTATFNESSYTNISIPLSNPDSTGVCDIEISGKTVTMNCHNSEEFDATDVMLTNQLINNNDSTTPLFLMNGDKTEQFGCIVSPDSDPLKNTTNSTISEPSSSSPSSSTSDVRYRKNSSGGLSGGAIAGIVIACVAVVAIVGAVIALVKSGKFAASKPVFDQNSTVDNFNYPGQTENIA